MIHCKINNTDVVAEEGITILEAAKKYNELALKHHGEFAYLNDIGQKKENNRQPVKEEKI
mgnify:CR=1 FL=1